MLILLYYVLSTCMLVKIDLDIAITTTEMLDLSQVYLKGPSSGSPCPVFELLIISLYLVYYTQY